MQREMFSGARVAATLLVVAAVLVACRRETSGELLPLADVRATEQVTPAVGEPGPERHPRRTELGPAERHAAEVRAALFSVEFHSRKAPPELPPELGPMPLDEAVRFLRADAEQSPFGESRRRRSIAKLAVADAAGNREQISVLLGGRWPEFFQFLENELPRPTGLDSDSQGTDQLEGKVEAFLDRGGSAFPECSVQIVDSRKDALSSSCRTPLPADVPWGRTTANVQRSDGFAALAAALDPQNWDALDVRYPHEKCNVYFVSAHIEDSKGEEDMCPPRTGGDWNKSLYEEFAWSQGNSDFDLATVLTIDADLDPDPPPGPNDHRFDYCLKVFVNGNGTYNGRPASGEADIDEGFQTLVETVPGSYQLVGDKKLHFARWTDDQNGTDRTAVMNALASINMKSMVGALNEAACCQPPPSTCGP